VRLHVCWGNNDGPHIYDIAMETILPELYRANVGALSIEFANPRHQHEYDALRVHPLPTHMLLIPGVLDTTTNFVEHPRVVGTFAGREYVAEEIVWLKLAAAAEGARIVSGIFADNEGI
jgi:5-methyltetrahydropteroyltriglutamate--homocysteine methyltransferase